MQAQLSTAELQTLQVISTRDHSENIPRVHLEKLSRLNLIEPGSAGIRLTGFGRKILVRTR